MVNGTNTGNVLLDLEAGGLNKVNGALVRANLEGEFYTTRRTGKFLQVDANCITLTFTNGLVTVFEYDVDFNFMRFAEATSDRPYNLTNDTWYVKINVDNITEPAQIWARYLSLNNNIWIKNPNITNTKAKNISFVYEVKDNGNTYYNSGILKLPPNYSPFGEPVKLIIFYHGASGIGFNFYSFSAYENYISYLCDEGYAVFDCWDYATKYAMPNEGGNNFGSPISITSIVHGYQWLVKNYNVSPTGAYMSGKSSGGRKALNLCYGKGIPLLACGVLAPAISVRANHVAFGYSTASRLVYADDFGFTGDTEKLLGGENKSFPPPLSTELADYIRENLPKTIGYMPMWNGLVNADLAELIECEISRNSEIYRYYGSLCRVCPVPTKIWIALDDTAIDIGDIEVYIQSIKNGQGIGELRYMPEGTGGHHAVDKDANALKVDKITTKLGFTHTDVPLAYVELVQWFRRFEN